MIMQWKTACHHLLLSIVLIHYFIAVRGDYILRVHILEYGNPMNRCVQCGQGCCDGLSGPPCNSGERCDNEFFFCVRPLGTPLPATRQALFNTVSERSVANRTRDLQCLQTPAAFRSQTNDDAASINFKQPTFLGLSNPLVFRVTANEYEGIQFYLDVIDRDHWSPDEFIDVFVIDIRAESSAVYIGTYRFASAELSFEVECLPGFIGERCTPICITEDPCRNNGICQPSGTTFTCTCTGDFTGETCETRIDDCQYVDCNDGACMDRVQSFICECEEGFDGQFCDHATTTTSNGGLDTIATTSTTTSTNTATTSTNTASNDNSTTGSGIDTARGGSSSSNVGAVTGAVIGSILGVLLVIVIIVSLLLVFARQRASIKGSKAESATNGTTLDNPVYDSGVPGRENMDTERDLDNPIYGLPDEHTVEGTYSMPDDISHFDTLYSSIST